MREYSIKTHLKYWRELQKLKHSLLELYNIEVNIILCNDSIEVGFESDIPHQKINEVLNSLFLNEIGRAHV